MLVTRPALKRSATTRRASAADATSSVAARIDARAASRSSRRSVTSKSSAVSNSASRCSSARRFAVTSATSAFTRPAVPQRPGDVEAHVPRIVPFRRTAGRCGDWDGRSRTLRRARSSAAARRPRPACRSPRPATRASQRLAFGPVRTRLRDELSGRTRAARRGFERGVDRDRQASRREARDAAQVGLGNVAHVARLDELHLLARRAGPRGEHVVRRKQPDVAHVLHVAQVRVDERQRLLDDAHRFDGRGVGPEGPRRVEADVARVAARCPSPPRSPRPAPRARAPRPGRRCRRATAGRAATRQLSGMSG